MRLSIRKPSLHYITLHYVYIIGLAIIGLLILYPEGNLAAIDAFFLGVSAGTVTGLTTVNVNNIKLYQQMVLYFVPMIGNIVFINMIVVIVRLHWFRRRIKDLAPSLFPWKSSMKEDLEGQTSGSREMTSIVNLPKSIPTSHDSEKSKCLDRQEAIPKGTPEEDVKDVKEDDHIEDAPNNLSSEVGGVSTPRITFAVVEPRPSKSRALYVPGPRERDRGHPLVEVDESESDSGTETIRSADVDFATSGLIRNRTRGSTSRTLEHVASSIFVVGSTSSPPRDIRSHRMRRLSKDADLAYISSRATVGRNAFFHNLTAEDREKLGGVEYRSLNLLLKVVVVLYLSLHVFGAICLVPWILRSNPKYRDALAEVGQNPVWWAFYSAQTMTNNLGFTLTPTSMIPFQDAVFPVLIMTLLAYAGNTLYPCLLRLIIWTMSKMVPKDSALKETLGYLLKYPRRCYMLLFPSRQTWVLLGILFMLNLIDMILFIVLDLHIPEVSKLPGGVRFVAALFQITSSRHTGTTIFNLANLNPAVQFTLLVMMYISVYPIALSVRSSNTYEEKALGLFSQDLDVDEKAHTGSSYLLTHAKNQLAFDLWYIFLGVFCLCISEAPGIMNPKQPGINVFSLFFESISAYCNVGLSLGYPGDDRSLSARFTTFGKVIICLLMLRGRHRGMPSKIDRAIMLPGERLIDDGQPQSEAEEFQASGTRPVRMKRYHTR